MARRQRTLSNHLQSNFEDYVGAECARKEAIKIFSHLGRVNDRAEELAFLSYIQVERRNFAAARQSVDEALQTVSGNKAGPCERRIVAGLVYPALWSMGDKERASQLLKEADPNGAPNNSGEISAIWILYFALLLLAIDKTEAKAKRALLNKLALCWKMQLQSSSSCELKAYWLHKLINLELYRSDLEAADVLSKDLLSVANSNS
jgi:hypothetical protein